MPIPNFLQFEQRMRYPPVSAGMAGKLPAPAIRIHKPRGDCCLLETTSSVQIPFATQELNNSVES
jgi:hypothetical protein